MAALSGNALPLMEPYSRHVLVCTGGYCSPSRNGRSLYSLLASLLQREGLLFGPSRVKRSEAPCLGVCAGGPIVAVYPEGIWYGNVSPALLERIVVEHLKGGKVIDEHVFHRLATSSPAPGGGCHEGPAAADGAAGRASASSGQGR